MSLFSFTLSDSALSDFVHTRKRIDARPTCAAVSGTNTLADLPVIRATLMLSSVWRSSHARFQPLIRLPSRRYFAKPAEPAATSKPPPRARCADSRLSTSEYTACSGPRGLGRVAGSAGFAGLCDSATLPALLAGGAGSETFPSGVVSLLLLPQAQITSRSA